MLYVARRDFVEKVPKNEMTMISLFALPALLIPNAWTVII